METAHSPRRSRDRLYTVVSLLFGGFDAVGAQCVESPWMDPGDPQPVPKTCPQSHVCGLAGGSLGTATPALANGDSCLRRSTVVVTVIGGVVATKKQKARAAAAGKESPAKPKAKKKTSRGK